MGVKIGPSPVRSKKSTFWTEKSTCWTKKATCLVQNVCPLLPFERFWHPTGAQKRSHREAKSTKNHSQQHLHRFYFCIFCRIRDNQGFQDFQQSRGSTFPQLSHSVAWPFPRWLVVNTRARLELSAFAQLANFRLVGNTSANIREHPRASANTTANTADIRTQPRTAASIREHPRTSASIRKR